MPAYCPVSDAPADQSTPTPAFQELALCLGPIAESPEEIEALLRAFDGVVKGWR